MKLKSCPACGGEARQGDLSPRQDKVFTSIDVEVPYTKPRPGDLVRLCSGGPVMVVSAVDFDFERVVTRWFLDDGCSECDRFEPCCLLLVRRTPEAKA